MALSPFSAWGGNPGSCFVFQGQLCQPGPDKNHLLAVSTWKLSPWAGILFVEPSVPSQGVYHLEKTHKTHPASSCAVDS